MKFEYNGRIYSPSNVEKKLQKLGITFNDIKILEEPKEVKEYDNDYELKVLVTPLDNIRRIIRVPKGSKPDPVEFLKHQIWNSKTGIKEFTKEFLETLVYEEDLN